jgi:adenosylcobyric acid synthase
MMATIGGQSARENYDSSVNQALDEIAAQLEEHTDIGAMIAIATGQ